MTMRLWCSMEHNACPGHRKQDPGKKKNNKQTKTNWHSRSLVDGRRSDRSRHRKAPNPESLGGWEILIAKTAMSQQFFVPCVRREFPKRFMRNMLKRSWRRGKGRGVLLERWKVGSRYLMFLFHSRSAVPLSPPLPPLRLAIRELKQQRRKRHFKSEGALLQTLSRLFYLIQFVKGWLFSSLDFYCKRLYQSTGKEKESRCLVLTSSTKPWN